MIPHSIGMKLHTPKGEDGCRIAEFHTFKEDDYEVAIVDDASLDKPVINSVHLNRREAEALRHWLDAVLTGTPAVSRFKQDRL